MYLVQVYKYERFICDKTFKIGDWKEIGYWLDDHGYIAHPYSYRITVMEIEDLQ